jgi:hypothetical protein
MVAAGWAGIQPFPGAHSQDAENRDAYGRRHFVAP